VLEEGDEGAEQAMPVEAEILELWCWDHRSWVDTYHFRAAVRLSAPLAPFRDGWIVESETRKIVSWQTSTSRQIWQNAVLLGLRRFSHEARVRIEDAGLTGGFGSAPAYGHTN
jgi:hypothetical protein